MPNIFGYYFQMVFVAISFRTLCFPSALFFAEVHFFFSKVFEENYFIRMRQQ